VKVGGCDICLNRWIIHGKSMDGIDRARLWVLEINCKLLNTENWSIVIGSNGQVQRLILKGHVRFWREAGVLNFKRLFTLAIVPQVKESNKCDNFFIDSFGSFSDSFPISCFIP